LLLAAFLCLPALSLAQSNARPGYSQAHKNAEKYQKHLLKQRRKQQKAQAKAAKVYRQQHR
jgi:hypothetical protein